MAASYMLTLQSPRDIHLVSTKCRYSRIGLFNGNTLHQYNLIREGKYNSSVLSLKYMKLEIAPFTWW